MEMRPSSDPFVVETLVTAHEAFPRLEALFLSAQSSVEMGFRLFDPRTKLRSDAARAIGRVWVDLLIHTLNRGVRIDLTLSDFDPIVGHDLHALAWRYYAICCGINESTNPGAARIRVRCFMHPAQGGLASRLILAPGTWRKLRQVVRNMNAHPSPARLWQSSPGLHDLVVFQAGAARMKPWVLPRIHPVTLHHKLAVFDAETTYIGGLDLNERRYDSHTHDQSAQQTWHDVQLVIKDKPLAEDARRYLTTLPDVTSGELPVPRTTSVFRTTLSRKRRFDRYALAPKTISRGLLDAHLEKIAVARQLIYFETQYFRDRRIVRALEDAGRRNPDLRFLLLLPAAPEEVAFQKTHGLDARFGEYLQARAIRRVRRAFGNRFLAISPAQPRRPDHRDMESERALLAGAPLVYVHAKVSLFDESAAIVSSANLNGRSMKWDAEAGVLLETPDVVRSIRDKVFSHWVGDEAGPEFFDPRRAFDAWRRLAMHNAARNPEDRRGFILPHAIGPAARIGVAIPGAPEELV